MFHDILTATRFNPDTWGSLKPLFGEALQARVKLARLGHSKAASFLSAEQFLIMLLTGQQVFKDVVVYGDISLTSLDLGTFLILDNVCVLGNIDMRYCSISEGVMILMFPELTFFTTGCRAT